MFTNVASHTDQSVVEYSGLKVSVWVTTSSLPCALSHSVKATSGISNDNVGLSVAPIVVLASTISNLIALFVPLRL